MNAIDKAIKDYIEADTEAGGMNEPESGAVGGVHQGVAPQNTPYPRYHFAEIDDIGVYSFSKLVADHCYYSLTALARDDVVVHEESGQPEEREGVFTAGRLIERARTKFTDPFGAQPLAVAGKTLLYCRFMRSLVPTFEKDSTGDSYIYSKGMILEIWLA